MSESKSASVVFTNSSLLAKNAQVTADSARTAAEMAQEQAITAQKTADGKNSVYRGSDPNTVPTAGLKEGDIYFTDNAVYTWTGTTWEKTVSDTTGAEIHAKVETAMQESQKSVADLKTDVEAKVSQLDASVTTEIAGIKATASGLTSTVIGGGHNWLNNTTDTLRSVSVNGWAFYTTSADEPVAKHQLDGQKVTLSAWIENPSKDAWVQMWTNTGGVIQGNHIPAGGSGWSQVTFTMPSGFTDWNIVVGSGDNVETTLSYSSLKLELGPNRTAWKQSVKDFSTVQQTANSLNAYVRGSNGSSTLAAILSMDPNNSTIAQVVNGQVVAAINTSSDGSVKIDGKNLYISASTKIDDAVIKSAMIDSIDASKITTGELDAEKVTIKNLTADKIASGTLNGMTITGSKFIANTDNGNLFGTLWKNYQVVVDNTEVKIHGTDSSSNDWESILTSDSLYLQMANDTNTWIKSIDIGIVGQNPHINLVNSGPNPGQYSSTYIGSDGITSNRMETNDAWAGNLRIVGHHIRPNDNQSNSFVLISNRAGTNFDSNGSVGFQVYGGVGLGKNTIYTATTDLYIQNGNAVQNLDQSYSSANKTTIHAQKLISQVANTVASRLSIKTDITPVSYDRALAAVEGTEMYDYRYVSDDSGQHYVSGIIDDVNPDPQYHMDEMLINKERTARIDANLVGYHHVVIQKLLERVAALEEKVK